MERIGGVAGQYWVTILLWTVVFVLATGREARGQRSIATHEHLAASMLADECSVFRSLAKRSAAEIADYKDRLAQAIKTSTERRAELEACAKSQGMTSIREDEEALAAEICPDAYRAWLYPGYGVQIALEDLEEANQGFKTLHSHIHWNCRPLPTPKALSASVTSLPVN